MIFRVIYLDDSRAKGGRHRRRRSFCVANRGNKFPCVFTSNKLKSWRSRFPRADTREPSVRAAVRIRHIEKKQRIASYVMRVGVTTNDH